MLELNSSEEEAVPSAPKRARTCDTVSSSASTAASPVAPLYLNKLQDSPGNQSNLGAIRLNLLKRNLFLDSDCLWFLSF